MINVPAKTTREQSTFSQNTHYESDAVGQDNHTSQIPAVEHHFEAGLQPKLKIGQPDDPYEREADRMADFVVRQISSGRLSAIPKKEKPALQRKRTGASYPVTAPDNVAQKISQKQGQGSSLPFPLQAQMEESFGTDFSQVRVHTDGEAIQLNQQLGARAFTYGSDVYFNRGEYQPASTEGQRLLAHELTHVVQQKGGYIQRDNGDVSWEEFQLAQQKQAYRRIVDRWYERYLGNLRTNAGRARGASQRFVNFEESGIDDLRPLGSTVGGVIALFGGPAAVVGLCVTVLSEVAARSLSDKEEKIAAAVSRLNDRLATAEGTLKTKRQNLDQRIDSMTSAFDHRGWWEINNIIANYGVPEIVSENIIYRDLLLELARGGDYNISGSQWNVDNHSIFGDAPWYHSWDWGSPGWTNGNDIAEELNNLAEGDPLTRTTVSINPP